MSHEAWGIIVLVALLLFWGILALVWKPTAKGREANASRQVELTVKQRVLPPSSFVNNAEELHDYVRRYPGLHTLNICELWSQIANLNDGIAEILAASVTGTGTAETLQAAQGEACQNGPQGDAQNTSSNPPTTRGKV